MSNTMDLASVGHLDKEFGGNLKQATNGDGQIERAVRDHLGLIMSLDGNEDAIEEGLEAKDILEYIQGDERKDDRLPFRLSSSIMSTKLWLSSSGRLSGHSGQGHRGAHDFCGAPWVGGADGHAWE
ncbi:hypothetical protein AMTR_s00017p00257630 [Amborella trichopoda]|uniref:Uncharacterized protein n=1 Tax=Amborella trichopoda TaxID=13333 RepID=W1PM96_AMBTC|nr:hypothetical protein AMTR_s00017p00257630 [Amborella trichopoda]